MSEIWPAGGTPVNTDLDPSRMLTWEETTKIKAGTELFIRINRLGDEVRLYPVRFNGVIKNFGERLIACTALGELVVVHGDSGADIETADGRWVAGLCYGTDGDPKSFLARSAEDIKGIGDTRQLARTRSFGGQNYKTLEPVRFISGLSSRQAQRMGIKIPDGYQTMKTSPRSSVQRSASTSVLAGQSVCVQESKGDLLNAGAIGALTCKEAGKYYIFSHGYNNEGNINSPLTTADMVMIWNSPFGAAKEAVPSDQNIGTAINDQFNGVIADSNAIAKTFPIDVEVSINNDVAKKFHHDITMHHGNDTERYFTIGASFLPMDHQLNKITGGSATGTLKILFQNGTERSENITLPIDKNNVSRDIVGEVTNRIYDLLNQDLIPGESPAGIELSINLSNQIKPELRIVLWDGNDQINPSTSNNNANEEFYLSVGKNYKIQVWVTGWPGSDVEWEVQDPNVAVKTGDGINCITTGNTSLSITVKNKQTGDSKKELFDLIITDPNNPGPIPGDGGKG